MGQLHYTCVHLFVPLLYVGQRAAFCRTTCQSVWLTETWVSNSDSDISLQHPSRQLLGSSHPWSIRYRRYFSLGVAAKNAWRCDSSYVLMTSRVRTLVFYHETFRVCESGLNWMLLCCGLWRRVVCYVVTLQRAEPASSVFRVNSFEKSFNNFTLQDVNL